jgi:hypothetical protein
MQGALVADGGATAPALPDGTAAASLLAVGRLATTALPSGRAPVWAGTPGTGAAADG